MYELERTHISYRQAREERWLSNHPLLTAWQKTRGNLQSITERPEDEEQADHYICGLLAPVKSNGSTDNSPT